MGNPGGTRTRNLVEEEEKEVEMSALILWHVTGAGCVAIWPVTVPVPVQAVADIGE